MEKISPTRMNLLLKKGEVKQVVEGIELLRNKRDVLLKEFFSIVKPLYEMRDRLTAASHEAISSLALSAGFEGREKLTAYSLIPEKDLEMDLSEKNLWGVKVPELKTEVSGQPPEFGKTDISLHIRDTQRRFSEFMKLSLRVLPEEIKLKRLGKEVKSTSRKINFLEKYALPVLFGQIKYIQESLEEREREDIFRLKRIKKKPTQKSSCLI